MNINNSLLVKRWKKDYLWKSENLTFFAAKLWKFGRFLKWFGGKIFVWPIGLFRVFLKF